MLLFLGFTHMNKYHFRQVVLNWWSLRTNISYFLKTTPTTEKT